jgi:hypothetical protein
MHPQISLSFGRQTSAQVATLHFSDRFICLSLTMLLAAFFFLFAMPKFELSLHYVPAAPIGQTAHKAEPHSFHSLIALSTAEAEVEVLDEAGMSASDLIDRWEPYIEEASRRFAVPQDWIRAVIRIESGGRTVLLGEPITSAAGAMGVMQLMRHTYDEMRERHDLGPNPYNVRDNILAGTAYLRELYARFGYPKLFAAYNAGPGRLADHLFHGARLPAETRAYLGGVVKQISKTCIVVRRGPNSHQRGGAGASDCRPKLRA